MRAAWEASAGANVEEVSPKEESPSDTTFTPDFLLIVFALSKSSEIPIYPVFDSLAGIQGAYTGKGISRVNYYFFFQHSGIERDVLNRNLLQYGQAIGYDPKNVSWPNGGWPHSGEAIVAESHEWATSPYTGGSVPVSKTTAEPVVYVAIVTKSPKYVLGVQGADCPSDFLYDAEARVIGLAHAGWKPFVRGVVRNTITLMKDLEAVASRLRVFVGPGVGDRLNEFQCDEAMEPRVREVFVAARREDLLADPGIRHRMSKEECEEVRLVTGREIKGGTALMLATLIVRDLIQEGVMRERIEVSEHSTICEKWPAIGHEADVYRYHSARRDAGKDAERPGFGVNLCVLFLEDGH